MIFYLVREKHGYTIVNYLESWGIKKVASFTRPLFYEQLWQMKSLPSGTYIFSDIERLDPEEAEVTARIWEQLSHSRKDIRLLNHPTRSMRRYELLRTLYEKAWNKFNVYRLTECRTPERFPVFLRGENDHKGNRTPLLNTSEELNTAVAKLFEEGQSRDNKLITEFCDTADEQGIFRKHSAFIIGDKIVPRHIFFSKKWMIKFPELVEEQMLLEEQEYAKNNPHESHLKEIFAIARIEYGRIDYSIIDGIPQVWEINTNPVSLFEIGPKSKIQKLRVSLTTYVAEQFEKAFEAINCQTPPSTKIPITIPSKKPDEPYLLKLVKKIIFDLLNLFPYPTQLATRKTVRNWLKKIKKEEQN